MIPFVNLSAQYKAYKSEIDAAIATVLESGVLIGGPEVQRLEQTLSQKTGTPFAISCSSGTSALALVLSALHLEPGDEVVLPDYTFVATAEAVVIAGGIPRFADVGEDFLISPRSVEERISEKTVGIIAVDLFGQCANYTALRKIAQKHGLWLLEDAAQSFGATQNGIAAGSLATAAATSFYPTKPFGAFGDGGAVFTNDPDIASRVREFSRHGQSESGRHTSIGTNSRLDALQAAVLNVKFKHLETELRIRQRNADLYREAFPSEAFRLPVIAENNTSVFAQYAVCTQDREAFIQKLSQHGIPTRIYYPRPLSAEPCFEQFKTTDNDARNNPNAYRLSRESFCLPIDAFSDVSTFAQKIASLCR